MMPCQRFTTLAFVWCIAALPSSAVASQQPPSAGPAQPPTGVALPPGASVACVDLRYVATQSKSGQAAFVRVAELSKKKSAEIEARARELGEQQRTMQQDPSFLQEAVRVQLETAFERSRVAFDRFRQDAEAEVLGLQRQIETEFEAKLAPIIDAVSKEKGLRLVFDVDRAAIVWIHPGVDISDEVVKRLDAPR